MGRVASPFVLLAVIAFAHFINDWYSLLIAPALPLIRKLFAINYFQAGLLLSIPYFVSAVLQSPVAHIAERYALRRIILAAGFFVLSCAYFLFWLSNSYVTALLATLFIGLGLSSYHPQGMGILSGVFAKRKGMAIGINGIGGALGYFFAPVSMGFLLSRYAKDAFLLVTVPGLIIGMLLLWLVRIEEKPIKEKLSSTITPNLVALGFIAIVVPFFSRGISSFLPAYFYAKGFTILNANLRASVMLIAGIIAQPLGGFISDKLGRRATISFSYALMGVFLLLFIHTLSMVFLFFMGFFMSLSIPVRHAFAAEIGGSKVNTNIAVVFGMVMIASSVAPGMVGALVDRFGFSTAFSVNAFIAFIGSASVWLIGREKGRGF